MVQAPDAAWTLDRPHDDASSSAASGDAALADGARSRRAIGRGRPGAPGLQPRRRCRAGWWIPWRSRGSARCSSRRSAPSRCCWRRSACTASSRTASTQRTQEIGIRMALGARHADVLSLVVRHGAALAAVGLAVGLAGALALSGLLGSLLFQVSPTDPPTFATGMVVLTAVAVLAAALPGAAGRADRSHGRPAKRVAMALAIDPLIRLSGTQQDLPYRRGGDPRAVPHRPRDPGRRVRRRSAVRRAAARRPCSRSSACSIRRARGATSSRGSRSRRLSPAQRARVRSRAVGFIFQAFNLIGDLDVYPQRRAAARLPRHRAGRAQGPGARRPSSGSACCTASITIPRSSPAASSSAWRWPVRWRARRWCCWRTSRPATSIRATAPR